MNFGHKVLWREGLFLTPQHFQAQDRRCEWLSWFHSQSLSPFFWGWSKLDIDTESIATWQFSLTAIQGIMRDGTPLDCPTVDAVPSARSFQNLLTPAKQSILVYLGLPRNDTGRPGVKMSEEGSGERMRYERVIRQTDDYVTGGKGRDIEYAVKRPEIRFEGEPSEALDLLPIAKLELEAAGKPRLVADFLPPSLTLSAAPLWLEVVNKLFGRVNALSTEQNGKLTYSGEGLINLTIADIPNYLKARELLVSLPHLSHYYHHPASHPFGLYQVMSDMVARLGILFGIFKTNAAEDFPPYDHDAPAAAILSLMNKLDGIFPHIPASREGELTMSAVPGREEMWTCDLSGARLVGNEEFYIWASADLSDEAMIDLFSRQIRVASAEQLDQLITFNLPGVKLESPANVPQMLPAPQKGHYFRVDTKDQFWQAIFDAKELTLHGRKEDFPNLQLRLHILRV